MSYDVFLEQSLRRLAYEGQWNKHFQGFLLLRPHESGFRAVYLNLLSSTFSISGINYLGTLPKRILSRGVQINFVE